MPVRKLDDYLMERALIQEASLSLLQGQRLGVEGMTWVKQIALQEPFHVAVGGPPLSLCATVLEHAEKFRASGVKPLFVFNGIAVPRKDSGRSTPDLRYQKRISGWEAYYKGEIERAATDFQSSEKHAATNYLHLVMSALEQKNYDCLRAPMLAWGQLCYFSRVHAVVWCHGTTELLMAGCERVVLSIDFAAGTFKYVELRRVLDDLGVPLDHFVDMCILAGFDHSLTFPPLLDAGEFTFRAAADMVRRYRSGYNAVASAAAHAASQRVQYQEVFLTARALVRHMLVLEVNNVVASLLHRESAPRDMHEVVGMRLPDELYYLVCTGAITTPQLNVILTGISIDAPPLVDSHDYRRVLDELLPMRGVALGILLADLHEAFSQRRIVAARWYETDVDHLLNPQALSKEFVGWHPRARGDLLSKQPTLVDVCRLLSAAPAHGAGNAFVPTLLTAPASDTTSHALSPPAAQAAEAIAGPLVKLLVLRGFALKGGAATAWGRAMACFSPAFAEEAMLLLELLRVACVHGAQLKHVPAEESEPFDGEREVLLLTRVFSLLPATLRDAAWEGPLDHDLLGFNSIAKVMRACANASSNTLAQAVHRALRNVLEAEMAARVMRRECYAPMHTYHAVARALPFVQESNTALGIVLKHVLLQSDTSEVAASFPNCVDIHIDLRRGQQFWSEALSAVRLLHAARVPEVSADVLDHFEKAEQLLAASRSKIK